MFLFCNYKVKMVIKTAKDLGKKIRDIRKSQGKSEKDIAKSIGISQGQYSKIEHGVHRPSFDKLVTICDYFGVTPNDLLNYKAITDEEREFDSEFVHSLLSEASDLSWHQKIVESTLTYERAERIVASADITSLMKYDGNPAERLHLLWTQGAKAFGKEEVPDSLVERVVAMCLVKEKLGFMNEIIGQRDEAVRNYFEYQSLLRNCYPGFGDPRWMIIEDGERYGFYRLKGNVWKLTRLIASSQPEIALDFFIGLAVQAYYSRDSILFSPILDENVSFEIENIREIRQVKELIYSRLINNKSTWRKAKKLQKEVKSLGEARKDEHPLRYDSSLDRVYSHPFARSIGLLHREEGKPFSMPDVPPKQLRSDAALEYAIRLGLQRAIKEYDFESRKYKMVIGREHEELIELVKTLRSWSSLLDSSGLDAYLEKTQQE